MKPTPEGFAPLKFVSSVKPAFFAETIEDEVLATVAAEQRQRIPGMPQRSSTRGQDAWRTVGVKPSSMLQAQAPDDTSPAQPKQEIRNLLEDTGFAVRRWSTFALCGLGSFCAALPAASALYINAEDESGGTEEPCTTLSCEFTFGDSQREMVDTLFSSGTVLGCIVGGWVADRAGRRPALWGSLLCLAIVGALAAFEEPASSSSRLPFFAAMHTLHGSAAGAASVSALVLALEWLPWANYGLLVCLFANFSVLAAPAVAALHELAADIRPWRRLLGVCTLPAAVCAPVLFLLVHESPRHLSANHGVDTAYDALVSARRMTNAAEPGPLLRDPRAHGGVRARGRMEPLWGQPQVSTETPTKALPACWIRTKFLVFAGVWWQPGWWVVRYASGVALMFYGAGLPYFGIRWLGGTCCCCGAALLSTLSNSPLCSML